jgi:two-component system, OmpR family, phosphate regulon sensor histidine kinase PhoR
VPTAVLIALAFAAGVLAAMAMAAARRTPAAVVNRGRVTTMLSAAKRYALGDLTRSTPDYGDDDLGQVARAMDHAIHETGRRVESLERDRARMEAIVASMIEGVLVVNEQGRLQLINTAARLMLGLDGGIGHAYVEAIRHPVIVEQIGRAMAGEQTDGLELTVTRDGARTVVARVAPVSAFGRGAVLVLHDITELRKADMVRRDFVANVSHELRTPLTAIKGYAEALLDDPEDQPTREKFLDTIHRHATRMERLVTDLLRLTRLDAGQETVDVASCDVEGLLGGIARDFEPMVAQKNQRIDVAIDPAAARLMTDAGKLHDVARNLIENAVNYTPEGGAIAVHAAAKGGRFELTVADSGPGIAPDDLARVFERFYRADKSRTGPGGTGLGLSIVKHLVHVLEGEVTASNQTGGGARFTVTLPLLIPDS